MLEYENSVFIKSPDKYTRDLDIIGNANKLTAEYLSLQTGKSFDECLEFVENEVSAIGTFPLKPIDLKVLRRKENGDRIKDIIPFDKLINYALKTKSIIAPNLVVYDNSEKNLSLTADYLEGGLAKRGIIKKTGFNAKQNGNMDLFQLCHNEEYSVKIYINSVSGAHCNPHTTSSVRSSTLIFFLLPILPHSSQGWVRCDKQPRCLHGTPSGNSSSTLISESPL